MKYILPIVLVTFFSAFTSGQTASDIKWPPENLRPDTITTYLFSGHIVLTTRIPSAKSISNFSFKTVNFKMSWMPVRLQNVSEFIDRSGQSFTGYYVLDTLHCNIFGKGHTAIVFKSKNRNYVIIYREEAGYQDIYLLEKIRKRNVRQALDFIELNLKVDENA